VKEDEPTTRELVLNMGSVRFDAFFNAGGEPFKGDLGWYILSPKKNLEGKRKQFTYFWRYKSGSVYVLPAGEWFIYATLADAEYVNTSRQITVEPAGEELHEFVFNAGTVRFDARLSEDGPEFRGDLGWYILFPKKNLEGKRKQFTYFWRKKSGGVFVLPAGEWFIYATLADAEYVNTGRQIIIEPGAEELHEFVFNAGTVKIDVTLETAPYSGEIAWEVYTSDKKHKVTSAWRGRSGGTTILPAGDYLITAYGPDNNNMRGETSFGLQAGEEKSVAVDMKQP